MGLGRLRRAVREGDVSQGTVLAGQVASMVKKGTAGKRND